LAKEEISALKLIFLLFLLSSTRKRDTLTCYNNRGAMLRKR
jgi:hypothetical protein